MKNRVVAYVLAVACIACLPSVAAVRLGMPFSDHMVLQREKPVAVWGTADPGEKVVVSFADKTAEATADAAGDWRVNIGPFAASKEGRILKANAVEVKDVLVGEVWFAGGQSNMGVPLVWVDPRHGDEKGAMIAQYVRRPYVRFANHHASWQAKPVRTGSVEWKELNWENVKSGDGDGKRSYGFSAVASYFALELYSELDVPIGVIAAYNGGTNIEAWTPREGFESIPELRATRISARFVCPFRSFVRLWQIVTVQFSCSRSIAIGLPTILLLQIGRAHV